MKDENRPFFIIGLILFASLLLFTLNFNTYNIQTDTSIVNIGDIVSLSGLSIQQKTLSAMILICIPIIIALIFILRMMNAKAFAKNNKNNNNDDVVVIEEIAEDETVETKDETITKENVFSNDEEFMNEIYDSFVKVQYAFMQFNYDALEKLLNDKLFDKYKKELKDLNTKKHKKIMKSFNKEDVSIVSTDINNDILTVKAKLKVNFIGYTLNEKSEVIDGVKGKKVSKTFELSLSKLLKEDKKITKCPHCGNKLEKDIKRCPNCENDVVSDKNEWIFKSIKEIK